MNLAKKALLNKRYINAVKNNDIEEVKLCLQRGADAHEKVILYSNLEIKNIIKEHLLNNK